MRADDTRADGSVNVHRPPLDDTLQLAVQASDRRLIGYHCNFEIAIAKAAIKSILLGNLEARPGVEPGCSDLQSGA